MQRQKRKRRKQVLIIAETERSSENGHLNRKKRNIIQKYSNKSQKRCTIDRDIEEKSLIQKSTNQKTRNKGNTVSPE